MSDKNPTIAELISALIAVVPAMNVDQARKAIREHNIRSFTKAKAIAAAHYDGKDAEALAQIFGAEEEAPKVTEKLAAKVATVATEEAKKEAPVEAPVEAKPAVKKISAKGTTSRKTAVAVTPGPRGFRFGEVWNKSVKAGEGVAILPANRYKLIKQAEMFGIPADKDSDAVVLAKQIAEALSAPKAESSAESASK